MNNQFSLKLRFIAPLLSGILLWSLPLLPDSTAQAESIAAIDTSYQTVYFPRRGELRRCFVTHSDICIFQERFREGRGLHYYAWSPEDLKATLQAEIAVKFATLEDYDRAIALARTITYPLPRVAALTQVAAYYGKTGQVNQAQQILAEVEQTARHSNHSAETLTRVAVQYAALEQEQTASRMIEEIILDLQSNEYPLSSPEIGKTTEIIRGLLELGRTSQAEQLIRQILQNDQSNADRPCVPLPCPRFHRAQWNAFILEPLIAAQESDLAIRIIQEETNNLTDQRAMLYEISEYLAIVGEVDQAAQLLQTIPDDFTQNATQPGTIPPPIDISEIVNSSIPDLVTEQQLSINKSNQAIQFALEGDATNALSMAETIPLPYHKALTLTEIAIHLLEVEQTALAEQVLSQAVQVATTLGGNHTGFGEQQGLSIIAVRLAEAEQFTRALEVIEVSNRVENQPYEIVALIHIADQYIRLGQTQNALDTLFMAFEQTELLTSPLP